jgi:hypothetical protein
MPLPDKVIEQLGKEPPKTPGWAFGALFFSGGILFLAVLIYAGLTYGYEPYLQNQVDTEQAKVDALSQSVSQSQQTQLIDFYSQISNLQALVQNHVLSSQFFTWLQNNTEANVYYQSFSLANGGTVTMTGAAVSEADINQQIAIFESPQNASNVSSVTVSSVTAPQLPGGYYTFSVALTMNPSVFLATTK